MEITDLRRDYSVDYYRYSFFFVFFYLGRERRAGGALFSPVFHFWGRTVRGGGLVRCFFVKNDQGR